MHLDIMKKTSFDSAANSLVWRSSLSWRGCVDVHWNRFLHLSCALGHGAEHAWIESAAREPRRHHPGEWHCDIVTRCLNVLTPANIWLYKHQISLVMWLRISTCWRRREREHHLRPRESDRLQDSFWLMMTSEKCHDCSWQSQDCSASFQREGPHRKKIVRKSRNSFVVNSGGVGAYGQFYSEPKQSQSWN